jgi:Zn-dependent protease
MLDLSPSQLVFYVIAMAISLTVHEYAHALISHIQGDRTPEEHGRLTLNPLAHLDIIGFISLFVFKFGWAKPVPIGVYNYKKPRLGVILTSFAGPASNLILSFFSLLVLYLLNPQSEAIQFFLVQLFVINAGLAVFNLLPFPPLDGSKIFAETFGGKVADLIYKLEGKGIAVLFILLWLEPVRNVIANIRQGVILGISFLVQLIV